MAQIRHIALIVKEPETLYDFYHQIFDVEQVRLSPTGSIHVVDPYFNLAFLKQTGGEVDLANTHRADGTEADQRPGINHFGVIVNKLDEVVSRLGDSVKVGESPQNGRPAEMRVIDPWGNNFDLSTRGFLGKDEPALPGVRHLAIHNEHPQEVADWYKQMLDLREIGRDRDGSILLSDGEVSMRVTKEQSIYKSGIQYFGVQFSDWKNARERFRALDVDLPERAPAEVHLEDPEGNIFLVSQQGWLE
jgi:catechol 2,3-dioxygenase-like lactoylglutathione lyase family enzyme